MSEGSADAQAQKDEINRQVQIQAAIEEVDILTKVATWKFTSYPKGGGLFKPTQSSI